MLKPQVIRRNPVRAAHTQARVEAAIRNVAPLLDHSFRTRRAVYRGIALTILGALVLILVGLLRQN